MLEDNFFEKLKFFAVIFNSSLSAGDDYLEPYVGRLRARRVRISYRLRGKSQTEFRDLDLLKSKTVNPSGTSDPKLDTFR